MDRTEANPAVAVMGAGAVGSYFGGMLARAGVPVTLIGRSAHVQAITQGGLDLDTVSFRERVPIDASTEATAVSRAGIVLFCVKSIDNEPASRAIAPHLSPRAVVVSLQNGVDNVERIYAASGIQALPAVVYVASALSCPGHVKHSGRGELVVGELGNRRATVLDRDRCQRVTELFTRASVPCRISTDIEADLWSKFVMNCAANAVAAIGQTTYGAAVREAHTREVMVCLIEETIAVARA
jgi:2-dehydropantoate 2-reductase